MYSPLSQVTQLIHWRKNKINSFCFQVGNNTPTLWFLLRDVRSRLLRANETNNNNTTIYNCDIRWNHVIKIHFLWANEMKSWSYVSVCIHLLILLFAVWHTHHMFKYSTNSIAVMSFFRLVSFIFSSFFVYFTFTHRFIVRIHSIYGTFIKIIIAHHRIHLGYFRLE